MNNIVTCNFTILFHIVLHILLDTAEQMLPHVFSVERHKPRGTLSDCRGYDTVSGQYHKKTLHCTLGTLKMYSAKVYCIHNQHNVY